MLHRLRPVAALPRHRWGWRSRGAFADLARNCWACIEWGAGLTRHWWGYIEVGAAGLPRKAGRRASTCDAVCRTCFPRHRKRRTWHGIHHAVELPALGAEQLRPRLIGRDCLAKNHIEGLKCGVVDLKLVQRSPLVLQEREILGIVWVSPAPGTPKVCAFLCILDGLLHVVPHAEAKEIGSLQFFVEFNKRQSRSRVGAHARGKTKREHFKN
eukprot:256212-Rhodomonas_salina.2